MAGTIHKGSEKHNQHLSLLAAEKAVVDAANKLDAEKAASEKKLPERKNETK